MKKSIWILMLAMVSVGFAAGGSGNTPKATIQKPGQSGNTNKSVGVPPVYLSPKEIEELNESDEKDVIVIDRAEYYELLKEKVTGAAEGGSAN